MNEPINVDGIRKLLLAFPQSCPIKVTIHDEGDLTTTTYNVTPMDILPDGRGSIIINVRKPLIFSNGEVAP